MSNFECELMLPSDIIYQIIMNLKGNDMLTFGIISKLAYNFYQTKLYHYLVMILKCKTKFIIDNYNLKQLIWLLMVVSNNDIICPNGQHLLFLKDNKLNCFNLFNNSSSKYLTYSDIKESRKVIRDMDHITNIINGYKDDYLILNKSEIIKHLTSESLNSSLKTYQDQECMTVSCYGQAPKISFISSVIKIAYRSPNLMSRINNLILLTDDNKVYNIDIPKRYFFVNFSDPKLIEELSDIISIESSNHQSLAISRDGKLYGIGAGVQYECVPVNYKDHWTIVDNIDDVVSVSCGYHHSLILNKQGQVYSMGSYNNSGELGLPDIDYTFEPMLIPNLNNIIQVSASNTNSFALTIDGLVYGFGSYQSSDSERLISNTPIRILGLNNVIKIAASAHYLFALKADNHLYCNYHHDDDGNITDEPVCLL